MTQFYDYDSDHDSMKIHTPFYVSFRMDNKDVYVMEILWLSLGEDELERN